jgi:hypothetical protein
LIVYRRALSNGVLFFSPESLWLSKCAKLGSLIRNPPAALCCIHQRDLRGNPFGTSEKALTAEESNAKKTDLPPDDPQCALQKRNGCLCCSAISCVFFSPPHSAGSSALKFSTGDAQPASDGELCRRGRKREVYLTMSLWWGVGG